MSELDKKLMQTPDLNKERLEKLKSLFPDLFTVEGKLNPDELKKIIDPDLVKETERFEFKWFGKSEAKRNAFTPSRATLIYDEERSVNPEYADGNMIIEGENLETLKCLLAGYRERIKCIYIDPPYNTGKDFVYSDKWDESKEDYWKHIGVIQDGVKVDTNLETSGRFHSNWLNMMYSRLLLARQLMREDGVIFISIDDNEIHHLRKLCDEVFGEVNCLSILIWHLSSGVQAGHFTRANEFILAYAKNKESLSYFSDKTGGEIKHGALKKISTANPASEITFKPGSICFEGNKAVFEGELGGSEKQYITKGKLSFEKGKLVEEVTIKAGWAMKNQILSWLDGKETFDSKGQKVSRFYFNSQGILFYEKERGTIHPKTVLSSSAVGNTKKGTDEILSLLGGKMMDFPKPSSLIKFLTNVVTDTSDIILDFFSGSGTTAHAVMELNKEDSSNRKFILIQIPELTDENSEAYKAGYKKISDITIERNKRVIKKLEKEEAEKQPSLLDLDKRPFKTGFKVYKLAKSNFPRVDFAPDPAKTEEENLALLNQYIDEKEAMYLAMIDEKNIFDEVILKNGFMLNYSKEQVNDFSKNKVFQIKDDFKECLICMDMSIANETLKELEQYKDKIFICLERALNTTMKWNLKHLLGEKLIAF